MNDRSDSGLAISRFIKEFERWIPGPKERRAEFRAELEAHLADAESSGSLDAAIQRLGSPRDAAVAFGAAPKVHPANLVTRAAAFAVDSFLAMGISFTLSILIGRIMCEGPTCPISPSRVASIALLVSTFFGIFAVLEWQYGATPGKRVARIRVVDTNGIRITFGQALIRRLPFVATGPFQFIDWAFALFTPLRQRAFDRVAGTVVIDESKTWSPTPLDEASRKFRRQRLIAITTGWSAIGISLLTAAITVVWRTGLLAFIVVFISALLGYVSIRTGLDTRPRDKHVVVGMVAGALGILPFIALMTVSLWLPLIIGRGR